MRYEKGKCVNQPVGKNTFYRMPSIIARFLNLPNPELYTGHAFRRTSATLLANTGADILSLKRHGGWKSSAIAESYVADSIHQKLDTANKILNSGPSSTSTAVSTFNESEKGVISSMENEINVSNFNEVSEEFVSNIRGSDELVKNRSLLNVSNCTSCSFTININKLN